jgi:hypothetical protein
MKIRKLIWGIFALIGIGTVLVGSIFVLVVLPVRSRVDEKNESIYVEDQNEILESEFFNEHYYSVILHTSGFSDKFQQLLLYKSMYPASLHRIELKSIVGEVELYYGREHEPATQCPIGILVRNDSLFVDYDKSNKPCQNVFNIDIKWTKKKM